MAGVLGIARGSIPIGFLLGDAMAGAGGREIHAQMQNPLVFQWPTHGPEQPVLTIHGCPRGAPTHRDCPKKHQTLC